VRPNLDARILVHVGVKLIDAAPGIYKLVLDIADLHLVAGIFVLVDEVSPFRVLGRPGRVDIAHVIIGDVDLDQVYDDIRMIALEVLIQQVRLVGERRGGECPS